MLAWEAPEAGVMARPPRDPKAPLLSPLVAWRTTFVTALFVVAMLGGYQWELLNGGSPAEARTVAMDTLVFAQCLYCVSCRSALNACVSVQAWLGNAWLLRMALLNVALQFVITYPPRVVDVFNTAPLGGWSWLRVVVLALAVYAAAEVEKQAGKRFLYAACAPLAALCRCRCRCKGLRLLPGSGRHLVAVPVAAASTQQQQQHFAPHAMPMVSRRRIGVVT